MFWVVLILCCVAFIQMWQLSAPQICLHCAIGCCLRTILKYCWFSSDVNFSAENGNVAYSHLFYIYLHFFHCFYIFNCTDIYMCLWMYTRRKILHVGRQTTKLSCMCWPCQNTMWVLCQCESRMRKEVRHVGQLATATPLGQTHVVIKC